MRALSKAMLMLDGAPPTPSLEAAAARPVLRASSPLAAANAMARFAPDLLVISAAVPWHGTFAAGIAPERRPAVIAVGPAPGADLADEWVAASTDLAEATARLRLAAERAHERRRAAGRAFVDALTGLPNRRAVVREL